MPLLKGLRRRFRKLFTSKKRISNIVITCPEKPSLSQPLSPTSPTPMAPPAEVESTEKDGYFVYLGGTCGTTTWREDVAIPLLEAQGITSYYNPQVTQQSASSLVAREAVIRENCRCLLFVISPRTFSALALVEAAYYIGRLQADPFSSQTASNFRLYLCLEQAAANNLSSPFQPDQHFDYHFAVEQERAWHYLVDIARRHEYDLERCTDGFFRRSVVEMMIIAHSIGRNTLHTFCFLFDVPRVITSRECLTYLAEGAGLPIYSRISEMMVSVFSFYHELMLWKTFTPENLEQQQQHPLMLTEETG